MSEELKDRLYEFESKLEQLQRYNQLPPSTLHILGRNQKERDWQRLLFHFLAPDRPHGLNRELLRHFLQALSDREGADFEFSYFDINDIHVETEVMISNGGRVDAVIWVPEEWFICWELKLYSSESGYQTEHYVRADSFESIDVEKQSEWMTGEYLYLAPKSAPDPQSEEFDLLSWGWVAAQLEAFLLESHGRYPARTTAQIEDFIEAIRSELNMTDEQDTEPEKAELYFNYYDDIAEVRRSFERRWKELTDTWGTRLAERTEHAEITDTNAFREDYVAVEVETEPGEREQWIFHQGHDWAGITKYGWRRSKTDLSPVYRSSTEDEEETYRIAFYHRLKQNQELAISDQTLELQLWHGTDSPDEFMIGFRDRLQAKIEDDGITQPSSLNINGSKGGPLSVRYDIPVEEYDDFFEAYVATLRAAFLDLVVENPGVVSAVDEAFEESLEATTDASE